MMDQFDQVEGGDEEDDDDQDDDLNQSASGQSESDNELDAKIGSGQVKPKTEDQPDLGAYEGRSQGEGARRGRV